MYGWERLGSALTAVLHMVGIPALRYVDDLFFAVPSCMGDVAKKCLVEAISLLGYHLEPSKTEGPASLMTILGVQIKVRPHSVVLAPDPLKAAKWIRDLQEALATNSLPPSQAAKMAGRLNFAASSVFGKLGSAHLRPLYARLHHSGRSAPGSPLNPEITASLVFWIDLLHMPHFRRILELPHCKTPAKVLYTDATGHGDLGFVLYEGSSTPSSWAASRVPDEVTSTLSERITQVTAFELLAPRWSIMQSPQLRNCRVDLYIDNQAAEHILRKGASAAPDLNLIADKFWHLIFERNITLRVFRVPSKENPSDAPSRGEAPEFSLDKFHSFSSPSSHFL